MEYCPKCENEMLPYLKTGELKEISKEKLVQYQLYYCLHCKTIYYNSHKEYEFIDFKKAKQEKAKVDAAKEKLKAKKEAMKKPEINPMDEFKRRLDEKLRRFKNVDSGKQE